MKKILQILFAPFVILRILKNYDIILNERKAYRERAVKSEQEVNKLKIDIELGKVENKKKEKKHDTLRRSKRK